MKNKIKFRTQQRMTHTKNYAAHTQKMAAEWAGPEFKKSRVQEGPKTQKYGPKPRNHGSTAELGEKSHKKHAPDVTKTPPDKNPPILRVGRLAGRSYFGSEPHWGSEPKYVKKNFAASRRILFLWRARG